MERRNKKIKETIKADHIEKDKLNHVTGGTIRVGVNHRTQKVYLKRKKKSNLIRDFISSLREG